MCGIFGAISESVSEENCLAALKTIDHRGPDHLGYESLNGVFLGHTRLSIIDLSKRSNQPLTDVKQKAIIVFNGEIYNFKELRQELTQEGFYFNSEGDAEVILNLYLSGKPDWMSRLNGIFACAIWDIEKEELLLFRDGFGVKPLYYSENEDGFFFSSEMKALLKIPQVPRDFDYNALCQTITFLWTPGPKTILSSVKKLEAGSYLKVKNTKIIETGKFWIWPDYNPEFMTRKDAIDKVENELRASVKEQLVADVPVGAFLSGGLDSSLIVAMAKAEGVSNMECFTIDCLDESGENDGFSDDLPYAKQVAKDLSVNLNIVKAKIDILKLLPKMIYHLDEPQADPAPLNALLISKLAKDKGIKVLFSGAGGDDVFSGYRRHVALNMEKYWSFLPVSFRKILEKLARNLPKDKVFFRRISKAFSYASQGNDERLLSYFYWINPDVVRDIFVDSTLVSNQPMKDILHEVKQLKTKNRLEKMLFLERKYFLVDHNFNYTDKMSMAYGIEVRVPFLSSKLAMLVSKIDSSLKQRGNIGKWVLKKVGERYLSKSVIYRPKSGFGAPLRTWLKGDLKPLLDEYLSVESLNNRGIFDAKKVQKLIEIDGNGKEDYSYPIFSILCIELWCRIFLDENLDGVFE